VGKGGTMSPMVRWGPQFPEAEHMKLRRETIVMAPVAASPFLAEHLKSLAEYPPR
jgi:hypothetical protein